MDRNRAIQLTLTAGAAHELLAAEALVLCRLSPLEMEVLVSALHRESRGHHDFASHSWASDRLLLARYHLR